MLRAFIAVPLEEAARAALTGIIETLEHAAGGRGRAASGRVAWVQRENLHLTLKFLGPVDEHQVRRAQEALDELGDIPSFRIDLRGIGAFPSPGRPRVIWIGIRPQEPVQALAASVESRLADLHPENRPFSAHITIGRLRDPSVLPGLEKIKEMWNDRIITSSLVDRVTLFQSILSPRGAVYRPFYTVRLNKEA
jgi:2'-5' RNA ligase